MIRLSRFRRLALGLPLAAVSVVGAADEAVQPVPQKRIGREVAVPRHLQDDEEFRTPLPQLLEHGKRLFMANWTEQEGGGRPLTKGNGKPLTDPAHPLTGNRAFNRLSAPDANSCYGCHNVPYGIAGGGGDFAANVFVLGQRFDFLTFDHSDPLPTKGAMDEDKRPVTMLDAGDTRSSPGMSGAGYVEMLARQMTAELQAQRDTIRPGETKAMRAKGISFGKLTRRLDGIWDVGELEGLPRASVVSPTPVDRPSLIVRPWHQASNVVSLREFANTALNQHHGIQTTERFGVETDPDGDGFMNELTRADVTALSLFQAAMAVPGRVIPRDAEIEAAVLNGEKTFERIGCASCHVPALPLESKGWMYSEPNPYNPALNLRPGNTREVTMDLNSADLPRPRLAPVPGKPTLVMVPLYSDLRLHDISDPADKAEPLDQNQTPWTSKFREGNRRFLTRRLWGRANQPPYFHHGMFTTLRQAVLAHSGEAAASRTAFVNASEYDQDSLIEFLKSMQVLPPESQSLYVEDNFKPREWPPEPRKK
jgi:hypothetical protein